jgi:hypothetical protein
MLGDEEEEPRHRGNKSKAHTANKIAKHTHTFTHIHTGNPNLTIQSQSTEYKMQ